MSEENKEKTTEENKPEENVEEPKPQGKEDTTDWKAEARKWEKRAKENSDAANKLAEIEESKKSDLDKLTEARDVATSEAGKAKQELARLRVALKKGLTEAQAKRLIGETEEELEADAEELLSSFKTEDNKEVRLPGKPKERLPNGEPSKTDADNPSDLADKITKRARGEG